MAAPDDVVRNYRVAFLRYLSRGDEAALTSGYEIGRAAVAAGVSILELAQIHHDVLVEVLRETPQDEVIGVATAASGLLLEVLATYDMAHRSVLRGGAT